MRELHYCRFNVLKLTSKDRHGTAAKDRLTTIGQTLGLPDLKAYCGSSRTLPRAIAVLEGQRSNLKAGGQTARKGVGLDAARGFAARSCTSSLHVHTRVT